MNCTSIHTESSPLHDTVVLWEMMEQHRQYCLKQAISLVESGISLKESANRFNLPPQMLKKALTRGNTPA